MFSPVSGLPRAWLVMCRGALLCYIAGGRAFRSRVECQWVWSGVGWAGPTWAAASYLATARFVDRPGLLGLLSASRSQVVTAV